MNNGIVTIGNWTGNWSEFQVALNSPFGIIFDYPNTTVSRETCVSDLAKILNMTYSTYITDVVQNSWWTQATVDNLAANGTMYRQRRHRTLHSSSTPRRHLQTSSKCTALICRDSIQVQIAKGCVKVCDSRRRLQTIEDRGSNMVGQSVGLEHHPITRRTQVSLLNLLTCLKQPCNYDKNQTNYLYQGWKEQPVQVRGNLVATLFYVLVDQHANATCKPILNGMTHWIFPLV
jgi:hypothetical protein